MRRPGDDTPEPPGGRAAERLRDFLRERMPEEQADAIVQEESEQSKEKSPAKDNDRTQQPSAPNEQPK